MILVIGEILIDRFPDYERIGGAPFNFAFHLMQMGWPVRFLTRIGKDPPGGRILEMLRRRGFGCEDIQIDPLHATGLVDITLDAQGVPQFDIRADAAFDHLELTPLDRITRPAPGLVYFGSLAQRTDNGYRQIQHFLRHRDPATRCFCDINLRPPHIHREAIQSSLQQADILKLNTDELSHISASCHGPESVDEAIDWLMRSYGLILMALTMGSQGSRIITAAQSVAAAPADAIDIVDTVGAGDAYAAVLAAGYLKGLALQRTVELATEFAARICGLPGAIPTDPSPYESLRRLLSP
jgi:fructokinase